MNIERVIRRFAGSFILISLALSHSSGQIDLSQPTWLWLTLFVGLNLLQSSFTGFCPLETMLRKWDAMSKKNA